jgi:hypothetical protein
MLEFQAQAYCTSQSPTADELAGEGCIAKGLFPLRP